MRRASVQPLQPFDRCSHPTVSFDYAVCLVNGQTFTNESDSFIRLMVYAGPGPLYAPAHAHDIDL